MLVQFMYTLMRMQHPLACIYYIEPAFMMDEGEFNKFLNHV